MRLTATSIAVSGETSGFRAGVPAMAWARAQAGAHAFSTAADPISTLSGLMVAGDAFAVILAAVVAHVACRGLVAVPLDISSTALLGTAMTLALMRRSGSYARRSRSPILTQLGLALRIWTFIVALLLVLACLTVASDIYARLWLLAWYVAGLLGLVLIRVGTNSRLRCWRRQGRLARTVAIVEVDPGDRSAAVAETVLQRGANEVCLIGVFSPERGRVGDIDDLMRLSRLFRIDEVIVVDDGDYNLTPLLRRLGTLPSNVSICTASPRIALPGQEAAILFGFPVLRVYRRPLDGWTRILKRVEDVVLATVLLILLSPLMLLIAIVVKLDSTGPVLFRQKRIGFNNNVFQVLKFRTMYHLDASSGDVPQARRGDPRVTRVGRWLRQTSLDELPQLMNVQRGDMSLVGPRPHAVPHDEYFSAKIDGYLSRHRILPGITGWAQVNGLRGETETLEKMRRRVEHDLAYIEDWSPWLDVKILARTLFCVFSREAF